HVADANFQTLPVGVPGELLIGGVGVARGYLGRPELTAERFVPNGLGGRGGERLYRTGDQARYTDRGVIEYLGRLDNQFKLRGFRIELGAIEVALRDHPVVRLATVILREDAPRLKRLVAYIVPKANAVVDVDELLEHLKQRLPEFMVPAAVV